MVEDALPVGMQSRLGLSLFQVELAPYASLDLRDIILPHWSVSFVLNGRVETVTRGERTWAVDGDAMLHPPHLPFSEFADGPGTHLYFVFDMQVSPHLDLLRLYPVSPVVRLTAPAEYALTFSQLGSAWASPPSPVRDLQVFALTTALLAALLQGWTEAGRPPRPAALLTTEDRFAGVVSYMADHLDQKISRDDLARRVFLHPGYFDRVFRAAYGVAPCRCCATCACAVPGSSSKAPRRPWKQSPWPAGWVMPPPSAAPSRRRAGYHRDAIGKVQN